MARTGDTVQGSPSIFNDGAGNRRYADDRSSGTKLYRGGKLVGEGSLFFSEFEVPAGEDSYRLEAFSERGAPSVLSTKVNIGWNFRSRHVPGETPKILPLSTIRFAPTLDADHSAPAGRVAAVPFVLDQQEGADPTRIRQVTVEVSYDDGVTWKRVPVLASRDRGVALLAYPPKPGFVSLRWKLTDTGGNSADATVIHAYRLR
jgi:hypothetical protein